MNRRDYKRLARFVKSCVKNYEYQNFLGLLPRDILDLLCDHLKEESNFNREKFIHACGFEEEEEEEEE